MSDPLGLYTVERKTHDIFSPHKAGWRFAQRGKTKTVTVGKIVRLARWWATVASIALAEICSIGQHWLADELETGRMILIAPVPRKFDDVRNAHHDQVVQRAANADTETLCRKACRPR